MTETQLLAEATIERPADEVWALLADYGNDPRWRRGVDTMNPTPAGLVATGTRTAEVLRFAGRTYRNDGEVIAVEPGTSFRWRTTSGVPATGSRTVTPAGPGCCTVRLETRLDPQGSDRVVVLLPGWLLRRGLVRDLRSLRGLVETGISA
ncbi:SRPBCC family protein [Nocardia sp. NPDC049149]|uniref:SRPBCC family protein n=1 Tax=Nocardia sp. NPDC049149 TaxID=3364315 RepID=UPI003715D33E